MARAFISFLRFEKRRAITEQSRLTSPVLNSYDHTSDRLEKAIDAEEWKPNDTTILSKPQAVVEWLRRLWGSGLEEMVDQPRVGTTLDKRERRFLEVEEEEEEEEDGKTTVESSIDSRLSR